MYSFSTINYGIGIGLFCVSLSLFCYLANEGIYKLTAAIPGCFLIAIYQGFAPALAAVFIVYFIANQLRKEDNEG